MRADLNVQMAKAKAQSVSSHLEWFIIGLRCSAARKNTELCGDDHAPVTWGRMLAQYPLPHGPTHTHRKNWALGPTHR